LPDLFLASADSPRVPGPKLLLSTGEVLSIFMFFGIAQRIPWVFNDNAERLWFVRGSEIIMKLILLLSFFCFSFVAHCGELAGRWLKTNASPQEKPVDFIRINREYYFHGQEKYIFQSGKLSHTIDQSVKITSLQDGTFQGTVDFFDSRGCVYKNLSVTGEFQHADLVNVLMTVPRYRVITITTTRNDPYERPRYCRVPYPGYGYYVCGTQREVIARRMECQLIDYVEVPVQLERMY
jgi:hypothetical protein